MTDNQSPDSQADVDPWAAAMQEQATSEQAASGAALGGDIPFKPVTAPEPTGAAPTLRDLEMVKDIPLTMGVMLGKTKMTIKQLLELSQGSVVPLDNMAGAPLEILINNYLLAKGEVVVVNDHYGIRITEILSPSERLQHLAK